MFVSDIIITFLSNMHYCLYSVDVQWIFFLNEMEQKCKLFKKKLIRIECGDVCLVILGSQAKQLLLFILMVLTLTIIKGIANYGTWHLKLKPSNTKYIRNTKSMQRNVSIEHQCQRPILCYFYYCRLRVIQYRIYENIR